MQILTFDLESSAESHPKPCDINGPLQRRLDSSSDLIDGVRWRLLLDVVRTLCADGPHPQAFGQIWDHELWLSPANPANRVQVQIWTDWRDYGPVRDGIPAMHYRIQIRRPTVKGSEDVRAEHPDQVKMIVCQAFGWAR